MVKSRRRAVAAFSFATLLIAMWVPASFYALAQVSAAVRARRETFTVLILTNELLSELKDAETGQRGYLLTGDPAFLEPWVSSRDGLRGHLERLRSLAHGSDALAHLDAVRPLLDAKMFELSQTIEMRRLGDVEGAVARVRRAEGKRQMDAIRGEMRSVVQAETESLATQESAFGESVRRLLTLMGLGSLTTLISALAFVYWMRREARHRTALRALELENLSLVNATHQKSAFLATMSHELRTPLNAIIGFSDVLHDGLAGPLDERQKRFLGTVLGAGRHLLSLINDILDLAKVEAGQMTLDLEPVPVPTLLANSVTMVEQKAAARRVRLLVDAPADLGSVDADARKLKQILYNLLSNAVKFTRDGGQVTLRARRVPRAEVGRLSGRRKGRSLPLADGPAVEFLEIGISDDGIGIAPEGLERLFEPFTQIDSRLARAFEGTGLGLTLVRKLTELHGGTVAVESGAAEGSRFVVWLPFGAMGEGAIALESPPPGLPHDTAA